MFFGETGRTFHYELRVDNSSGFVSQVWEINLDARDRRFFSPQAWDSRIMRERWQVTFVLEFAHFIYSHIFRIMLGSIYISGKMTTYPSPEPTFIPKWEISVNVGLGQGWVDSFPEN